MFPLQLFILLCLAFICYQDMRYRAVYWICFPVLSMALLFLKQSDGGIINALTESAYGIIFFGLQVFLLWIYFSVKNRTPVNITKHYLGLGDILFLLAIAFYLSPVNYVIFYISSLMVVLVYTLIQKMVSQQINKEIPLAGLQALMLGGVLIYSIINPGLKLYNDSWIYGL